MRMFWAKVTGIFLGVVLLMMLVIGWLVYRAPASVFPDLEALEPSLAVCQSYIQTVYGLRGSLNAPQSMAKARSSTSKPSGETTWHASFYPQHTLQQPKRFVCTARPAGTGYTVTRFEWLR